MNQLCFNCTFKHLSCAWVAWCEVSNGYREPQHIMKVVGHMANAEEHLVDEYPELAARVRAERSDFWDAAVTGSNYRPDFEELLSDVWTHLLVEQHEPTNELRDAWASIFSTGDTDDQEEEEKDE